MFRNNNRLDRNDSDRFDLAVRQIVGKRLAYSDLVGKSVKPTQLEAPKRGNVEPT